MTESKQMIPEQSDTVSSASLYKWISQQGFPCVGAKSALAQANLSVLTAGSLVEGTFDAAIVAHLQCFAQTTLPDAVFVSSVILFPDTPVLDEASFEATLWDRLQAMNSIDARNHDWDAHVSDDPGSPHFSMSIGRRGFYVIGLHPGAHRRARRFNCAAMVFNPHSQFETLRRAGHYEKLRATISERDIAYSGTRNPMLGDHGKASQAAQYSGRHVGPDWACPFSARQAKQADAA